MERRTSVFNILSGNSLKIIAAVSMLIDHIGLIIFPNVMILRIIGRIAFPIFAFFIAEGCKHTKNKLRYILTIFVFGIISQAIHLIFVKDWTLNILFTFSISILLVFLLDFVKQTFYDNKSNLIKITALISFCLSIMLVYFINNLLDFDYGFWGCMLPLLLSLVNYRGDNYILKRLDCKAIKLFVLSIGLVFISISFSSFRQLFSLFAVLLLMFYSHKKGTVNMKYFFYIFYVGHLLILYLIKLIVV